MALQVQIATAQDPGGTMTVLAVPVLHVKQPGVGQADKPSIASRVNHAQPMLGARHATSAGLIILPTSDASITNDPCAAAIETTINAAIATIESQFSDPIIINIVFQKGGGLASSLTYVATGRYATFLKT